MVLIKRVDCIGLDTYMYMYHYEHLVSAKASRFYAEQFVQHKTSMLWLKLNYNSYAWLL